MGKGFFKSALLAAGYVSSGHGTFTTAFVLVVAIMAAVESAIQLALPNTLHSA